ncbi:hypothetical protein [Terribacillus aidingensis]|uniref:DUF7878 domain-containing protein n=1 Tax=Terribacillus aidingensis TaxID=586416 RepID=UPI00344FE955
MQQLLINFDFRSDFEHLSNRERRQFGNFLYVEGLLEIKINDRTYFYEEACPLLEFYLQLEKWLKKPFAKRGDFLYNTLELDEEEPFLAVLHFQDFARLNVIWPEADVYNVFPADYVHEKLQELRDCLDWR